MSTPVFPLPYTFDVDKTSEYLNRTVVFESGKKQKQRKSINKLVTWKITVKGTDTQRKTLESFHDSVNGDAGIFYFYDEDGVQVLCRFADGKLPLTLKREFTSANDTHGIVVGFTCSLTIEKVI